MLFCARKQKIVICRRAKRAEFIAHGSGRKMVAGGKLALASAAPGYFKKESEPVITGDRKVASISCIAFCHPFHGLHNIFVHNRGCVRCAGLPLPFIFYPLARAQNSAGVRPRIRKINSRLAVQQEVAISPVEALGYMFFSGCQLVLLKKKLEFCVRTGALSKIRLDNEKKKRKIPARCDGNAA